jgi:hypothetical protein
MGFSERSSSRASLSDISKFDNRVLQMMLGQLSTHDDPTMKFLSVFLLGSLFTQPLVHAATEVAFGPVRGGPGESVRMVSTANCAGGSVEIEKDGKVTKEALNVITERDITWTFRDPAADGSLRGMVRVAKISTRSSVTIHGKEEKSEVLSPLSGMSFTMTKKPAGDWKFELDGSLSPAQVQNEILELTTYLKRNWYPQRVVKVGDSWEFDPAWARMIIEKDFQQAQTIGTMKLRQIQHSTDRSVAVIDMAIHSGGGDLKADGRATHAQIDLTGRVVVNLNTMLDESLELRGTMVSSVGRPGDSKKVTLPVDLIVRKSFVR